MYLVTFHICTQGQETGFDMCCKETVEDIV